MLGYAFRAPNIGVEPNKVGTGKQNPVPAWEELADPGAVAGPGARPSDWPSLRGAPVTEQARRVCATSLEAGSKGGTVRVRVRFSHGYK